jgi:hypothetical protein
VRPVLKQRPIGVGFGAKREIIPDFDSAVVSFALTLQNKTKKTFCKSPGNAAFFQS